MRKIIAFLLAAAVLVGGLFAYEVNKKHHYIPQTAEIKFDDIAITDKTFILQDGENIAFDLKTYMTFVSDVENGTANLETIKKVFGFYECEINWVYDEYSPVVTYKTDNEAVASVDRQGVISATAKGKANITVTADNVSLDIPVTVYKGVEIDSFEQGIVLLKGDNIDVLKLDEYEVALSQLYSSDENIVTINQNGIATALKKGKAEIYTYKDEAKKEKVSTTITVKQPVETVTVNKVTAYVGDTVKLKASYTPQNADYGTTITYKVADSSVATINGNMVTAVKAGETVITATSGNGVTGQAKLVVKNPPQAIPTVTGITKAEFESYTGEKFSDGSPYASYFKITLDQPVVSFSINYVNEDINAIPTTISTGAAIYKNASVPANTPLYFAVCINTSDVVYTRGYSFVNRDGSKKYFTLYQSLKDGSMLTREYVNK